MSHDTRSAAILAGGKASRFDGRDKSALLVNGRTIMDRQIAELRSAAADVMVIGGRAEYPSVRAVTDLVPGCGPIGGLHAALSAAHGDHVAIVACDMPYVTAVLIEYLFSLAPDADVVIPKTEDGYHPLCAVYARTCLGTVAAHMAEHRLRMTDILADVRVRRVTAEEIDRLGDRRRLLANVNTPSEYADLGVLQSHKP